jgi:hypothetical protein
MRFTWIISVVRAAVVLLPLGVFGCGRNGPATYPVEGKVELAGADVKNLAGSHIEAVLASDSAVRASGQIQDDGRFSLDTLHAGAIFHGAPEGNYRVRIIIADDDPASRRRAALLVSPRFLDDKTSGLSIDVPTSGEVTIAISPR